MSTALIEGSSHKHKQRSVAAVLGAGRTGDSCFSCLANLWRYRSHTAQEVAILHEEEASSCYTPRSSSTPRTPVITFASEEWEHFARASFVSELSQHADGFCDSHSVGALRIPSIPLQHLHEGDCTFGRSASTRVSGRLLCITPRRPYTPSGTPRNGTPRDFDSGILRFIGECSVVGTPRDSDELWNRLERHRCDEDDEDIPAEPRVTTLSVAAEYRQQKHDREIDEADKCNEDIPVAVVEERQQEQQQGKDSQEISEEDEDIPAEPAVTTSRAEGSAGQPPRSQQPESEPETESSHQAESPLSMSSVESHSSWMAAAGITPRPSPYVIQTMQFNRSPPKSNGQEEAPVQLPRTGTGYGVSSLQKPTPASPPDGRLGLRAMQLL